MKVHGMQRLNSTTLQGMASILAATAQKASGQEMTLLRYVDSQSSFARKMHPNFETKLPQLVCRTVMQKSVHHYPLNWFGTFEMPPSLCRHIHSGSHTRCHEADGAIVELEAKDFWRATPSGAERDAKSYFNSIRTRYGRILGQ